MMMVAKHFYAKLSNTKYVCKPSIKMLIYIIEMLAKTRVLKPNPEVEL